MRVTEIKAGPGAQVPKSSTRYERATVLKPTHVLWTVSFMPACLSRFLPEHVDGMNGTPAPVRLSSLGKRPRSPAGFLRRHHRGCDSEPALLLAPPFSAESCHSEEPLAPAGLPCHLQALFSAGPRQTQDFKEPSCPHHDPGARRPTSEPQLGQCLVM